MVRPAVLCFSLAAAFWATALMAQSGAVDATFAAQDARTAEKAGNAGQAWLLYSQAAAADPSNRAAWVKAQALQRRALMELRTADGGSGPVLENAEGEPVPEPDADDLRAVRELGPPARLDPQPGVRSVKLRGESQEVVERLLKEWGVEAIFEENFQSARDVRLTLENTEFSESLEALQMAAGVILVPVSERLVFVARDTQQSRQQYEPNLAVSVPIPEPLAVQEAQEMARAVQQLFDLQKLAVDTVRRIVVVRGRQSQVTPAVAVFDQLLRHTPEVAVDVEFLEVSETAAQELGLRIPGSFALQWLPDSVAKLPNLFSGKALAMTLMGGEFIGTMRRSQGRTLHRAQMRTIAGQAAQLHLGDRYPILTAGYFGSTTGTGGETFAPPPTVQFEDLGVVLKVTPFVHGPEDVSLDIEAEYKVLTGEAANGIPVIATRKFTTRARAKPGEVAVVGGLLRLTEARNITGVAGLSQIPGLGVLFRQNSTSREAGEVLIVVTPHVTSYPAARAPARQIWTGSESRWRNPL